jgi:hypothetical protein
MSGRGRGGKGLGTSESQKRVKKTHNGSSSNSSARLDVEKIQKIKTVEEAREFMILSTKDQNVPIEDVSNLMDVDIYNDIGDKIQIGDVRASKEHGEMWYMYFCKQGKYMLMAEHLEFMKRKAKAVGVQDKRAFLWEWIKGSEFTTAEGKPIEDVMEEDDVDSELLERVSELIHPPEEEDKDDEDEDEDEEEDEDEDKEDEEDEEEE